MHGINGLLYANLKNLSMCRQDKVSWHLIGLGNEVDMHTVTFYGATVMENQNRKDTVSLLPGEFMISGLSKSNSMTLVLNVLAFLYEKVWGAYHLTRKTGNSGWRKNSTCHCDWKVPETWSSD